MRLRIATYNVHGAVGVDRRHLPARQLEILRRINADCIALQEFVNHPAPGGGSLLDRWCDSLGMHGRFAPSFIRGGKEFGNAVLSRFAFLHHAEHDMSFAGGRRRIALDVVVDAAPHRLHLVAVHCAVRARPRACQRPLILALAREKAGDICIVLGDFNEWRTSSGLFMDLREEFECSPPLPTFPAIAPVLALDRIWVHPRHCLESTHVDRLPPAPVASDHLPVVATVHLSPAQ